MPVFTPQGRTVRIPCGYEDEPSEPFEVTSQLFGMQQLPVNLLLTNPNEVDVWVNVSNDATDLPHWPRDPRDELPNNFTHHGGWGFRLLARSNMKISHGAGPGLFLFGLAEQLDLFFEVTPGEGT